MELQTEYINGHLLIRLKGELDHHAAGSIFRGIETALDRYLPRKCSLDLSGIGFMDSSGIAVILRTQRRLRENGGSLVLLDPAPAAARVITASGTDRLVSIKYREGRIAK